ncbi:hypothetical protein AVL50_01045 [Flammeovirga sp. SJP92]|nr:hypothetical protein AVL50_01045 [Flammeovirga sp. SJP92]
MGFLYFFFFIKGNVEAQQYPLDNIYPLSPESTGLLSISEQKISASNGTSNFSIPLGTFKEGNLEVPITLSYNSEGNRVNNVPGWVGLGWTLQAGGSITRQVNHIPDESASGAYWESSNMDKIQQIKEVACDEVVPVFSDDAKYYLYKGFVDGNYDSQPDIFTINLPNIVAKFSFGPSNDLALECDKKITIEKFYEQGKLYKFIVKDIDGTSYVFGSADLDGFVSEKFIEKTSGVATAWLLREIISNDKIDKIEFTYGNTVTKRVSITEYLDYTHGSGGQITNVFEEKFSKKPDYPLGLTINQNKSFISGNSRLETISGTRTKNYVSFNAVRNRRDGDDYLADAETADIYNEYFLSSIDFYKSINSSYLKYNNYEFKYNYTGLDEVVDDHDKEQFSRNKRLFLKELHNSISEGDSRKYEFLYRTSYPYHIPDYLSKSVDFWGFSNGQGNTTLIKYPRSIEPLGYFNNRNSSERYMKMGILETVKYPTGGKVKFNYEANKTTTYVHNITEEDVLLRKDYSYVMNLCSEEESENKCPGDSFKIKSNRNTQVEFRFLLLGPQKNTETFFELKRLKPRVAIFKNGELLERKELEENLEKTEQVHTGVGFPNDDVIAYATHELIDENDEIEVKLYYDNKYNPEFTGSLAIYLLYEYTYREKNDDSGVKETTIGGLRVKDIEYLDINDKVLKKVSYEYPNPMINHSYNFLTKHQWWQRASNAGNTVQLFNIKWDFERISSSNNSAIFGSNVLSYYGVDEILEGNGSTYNSVINQPFQNTSVNHEGLIWEKNFFPFPLAFHSNPNNGKPSSTRIFNEDGELVQSSANVYGTVINKTLPCITLKQRVYYGGLIQRGSTSLNEIFPVVFDNWKYQTGTLLESIQKETKNGNQFEVRTKNEYYSDNYLLKKVISSDENTTLETEYFYLNNDDLDSDIKTDLLKNNEIANPTKIINRKNGDVIQVQKNEFSRDLATEYPKISDFYTKVIDKLEWKLNSANTWSNGRLQKNIDASGITTMVVWDANLIHPIFIIKGENVAENIDLGNIVQGLDSWKVLSENHPDHIIKGFVYGDDELLIEEIDENGRRLYFTYNSFRELESIKNDKGEYISLYEYKYHTETK